MPACCPARPDDDGGVPIVSGDLLICCARVIDGTGAPWFLGDVWISGGRIAAIGASLPADDAVVDADGRYLAPGFIDAHRHDDLICLREPE
jgi:N-acyl-D-amino-acid deacylase